MIDGDLLGLAETPAARQVNLVLDDVVAALLAHLLLELLEHLAEPLERVDARADPEEVDLAESGRELAEAEYVRDVFEYAGVGRRSDARAHQHHLLVLEHVLGARAERTVHAQRFHLAACHGTLERLRPVAAASHVNAYVRVVRRRRHCERMPLEPRDFSFNVIITYFRAYLILRQSVLPI